MHTHLKLNEFNIVNTVWWEVGEQTDILMVEWWNIQLVYCV